MFNIFTVKAVFMCVCVVLYVHLQLRDATSNTRQGRRVSQLWRPCHELSCVTHHSQTTDQSILITY